MEKETYVFVEPEADFDKEERQPASYLRRSFDITKPVREARLEMTALGTYIGYLNGQRLTEEELQPGYTDYRYRVQLQSYDVTPALRMGKNVAAAVIGDGWYRGGLGASSKRNQYGSRIKWMFRLTVHYEDGTSECICADRNTKATQNGPLRQNDIKIDEVYDARKEMTGWADTEFDDSAWHGVREGAYGGQMLDSVEG